jgi:pyruvate-formate lyase
LHLNDTDYWRYLEGLSPGHPDLPSPRIGRLLYTLFRRWKSKPVWPEEEQQLHLSEIAADWDELQRKPVIVRKARAVAAMLELLVTPPTCFQYDSLRIDTEDLLLGVLPPFSVGQGKYFVGYLTSQEQLEAAINYQGENGPMGHIVPNYEDLLRFGFQGVLKNIDKRADSLDQADVQQHDFLEAARIAIQAVIAFGKTYANKATKKAESLVDDAAKGSLLEVACRLERCSEKPPESFADALQLILLMHCVFHWTQEIVPIGRLDQLLIGFYREDVENKRLVPEHAQELLDAFWLKLDERVILDRRHAEDRFGYAEGPLTGQPPGPSNYDQGALLNQWMQQITIGGVVANDDIEATDATNDVTYLCLESARRLPLNSPTLDLRVHKKSPKDVLRAAAATLLSGGAHPVLLNDDLLVPSLQHEVGGTVSLKSARNYACDGCYETMYAGETEFSFGFIPAMDVLEKALNQGATLGAAGAVHLRGSKDSWRTKAATLHTDFEDFWATIETHIQLSCHRYYRGLLDRYLAKRPFSPSPLLSVFISGCVEKARDLTFGGSRYHLFSPLMTGVSSAADSLYCIKKLVFEQGDVGMDELLHCLKTDWGDKPADFPGPRIGVERIIEIRDLCLSQPKLGTGVPDVDMLGWKLLESFVDTVSNVKRDPIHKAAMNILLEKLGLDESEFEILLAPGIGTFEQYVFGGFFAGASADGRKAASPLASDLSPSPIVSDQPALWSSEAPTGYVRQLDSGFKTYQDQIMKRLPDGGAVDFNIPEATSLDELTDAIQAFANGEASSVATFTVADPDMFRKAQENPQDYNLLRVRMGGWTEFFISLFPAHQAQHSRRPLYTVGRSVENG